MTENKKKTVAALSVIVILCASCAGIVLTEPDEEPDGFVVSASVAVAVIAGAVASGFIAGLITYEMLDSGDTDVQPYLRLDAANNVADVMSVASAFTANTNANYAQLWNMTKEHWIRQAELEAYTEWGSGRAYDGNSVLEGAHAYENNAVMTANAVAQFNSFFDELSNKISDWNGKDTYRDKMSVGFAFGNTDMLTKSGLNADLVSVAKGTGQIYIGDIGDGYILTADTDVSEGSVAYVPGYIYNFGSVATIVGEDGTAYTLDPGRNYLSDMSFKPGIYTVTDATLGGDTFSATVGSDISLKAGIAIRSGSDTTLAYLDNGRVVSGVSDCERIYFRVVPEDIPSGESVPDAVDVTAALTAYQTLLDRLYWTSVNANNAASAVWNIYDRADAKDHNVTTLMNSNAYNSVVLSDSMNEILTLSAMQQLATYYDANGEDLGNLKIGLYGDGMDAPFFRGNIVDEFGNAVYRDVIYTPFFQSDSVVMKMGVDHEVAQNCLVAVWNSGQELTSWYEGGLDTEGYETVMIGKGYTLQATQMASCDSEGMHNRSEIPLEVTKVNYISPENVDFSKNPDYASEKNILRIVCMVAGIALAVMGIVRRSPVTVVVGLGIMVFGAFFADAVWDRIGRLLG